MKSTISMLNLSCQSQWPRGLRRRSVATHLLRSWVRIPLRAWMFVCCECCVLSGRGLCDGLATHPEESYRLWRVAVCSIKTSSMRNHNINPLWLIDWLIDQRDLFAGGDLIMLVYKVRHPASTLVYRIVGILIADSINTEIYISYFRFSQFIVPVHCFLKQECSWRARLWDCSQQQRLRGSKFGGHMSILNEKSGFLYSTNFKLLSEIWENSINKCDFF
jgi:hypothetical protein